MSGRKEDPDSPRAFGSCSLLRPSEDGVPMARRCGIECDLVVLDHDVAVADNATVQLQHSQPPGSELRIVDPGDDLLGVDRALVAVHRSKESGDLFCVAFAKFSKHGGGQLHLYIVSSEARRRPSNSKNLSRP